MSFWPNGSSTRPAISSPFGKRKVLTPGMSAFHEGIDSYGYAVNYAVTGGTVIFAGYNGGAGYEVRWNGDDGREHRDLHHVAGSLRVAKGQRIERGTPLGLQGRTGTATGVHNHHGVRVGGTFVDPMPILTSLPSSSAPAAGGTTPIHNLPKGDSMRQVFSTTGSGYVQTDEGFAGEGSPQIHNLFWRVINSDQSKNPFNNTGMPDQFNPVEINMMDQFLRLMVVSNQVGIKIDDAKLRDALNAALGQTKIRAELSDEEIKRLSAGLQIDTGISNEELAAAFDVAQPRIIKALLKAQGEALAGAAK